MKKALILITLTLLIQACSKPAPALESISLSHDTYELNTGETIQLEVTTTPDSFSDKVVWYSSDEARATVDKDGLVTAISQGTVTISASCETLTSSCKITIKGKNAQVGDFLFSDGTYSSYKEDGKKIIGVIFWAGDPTAQDPSLKREHPECTHGLAVAIDGNDYSAWQKGYARYGKTIGEWIDANLTEYFSITTGMELEDNLNKTVGYNNTKAIEAFNDASENAEWKVDAVEKVRAYRSYCPAPENSSDWYLPSAKELSLLCSGEVNGNIWDIKDNVIMKQQINDILSSLPKGQILEEDRYWSSSEGDVIRSIYINFSLGLPNITYVKDTDYLRLRFIIAF